jgi:hypothetical protein
VLKSEKIGKEVFFWTDVAAIEAALTAVQDFLSTMR